MSHDFRIPKLKMHPIREASIEIGNLAYAALRKGYSLRLISVLMDTSYGVAYQSMISSEKGRGGVRGRTHHADKASLESYAKHLLAPMAAKGITPRRWCSAYHLELHALFDPTAYEMNYDIPVLQLLQEDFPEAYDLSPAQYEHAYIEVQGFEHIACRKKKIHLYKSTSGVISVSRSNGKALGIACKVQGLKFQAQRLKVLLDEGEEAALRWLPTRLVNTIPAELTKNEREIYELLRREASREDLIDRLVSLPQIYLSENQLTTKAQIESKLKELGMSEEQVDAAVKTKRLKVGIY